MVPSGRGGDRPEDAPAGSAATRLLWFVGLWVASVAAVGAVAYAIRLWIV